MEVNWAKQNEYDNKYFHFQFSQMLDGAPLDPKGNLDYAAFTRQIKRGKEDE